MAVRVSVCIPAFRAEKTLAETMTSVLDQTWQEWELVVVDDGSDDATSEIARSFGDPRIRVVTNRDRQGMVANFNRAVEETTGELVKLLCADDLIRPTCLADQVAVLDAYPSVALTAARRDLIDGAGAMVSPGRGIPDQLAGRLPGPDAVRRVVAAGYNPLGEPGSVLFRREAQRAAGPFSARYIWPMDLDLWIRILRHGELYGDVRTLAAFRIHASSVTTNLLAVSGQQDRALLRELAHDDFWGISHFMLWNGLARSLGYDWYRRLRVRRVNRRGAVALGRAVTSAR